MLNYHHALVPIWYIRAYCECGYSVRASQECVPPRLQAAAKCRNTRQGQACPARVLLRWHWPNSDFECLGSRLRECNRRALTCVCHSQRSRTGERQCVGTFKRAHHLAAAESLCAPLELFLLFPLDAIARLVTAPPSLGLGSIVCALA